jgi:multidrug efflux pump subunit AcrA (membrane-fusion protein)
MPTASWNQLERAIEHVHAAARSAVNVREFYRQLIAEATAALDAAGGAAWRCGAAGRAELLCQDLPDDGREENRTARLQLVDGRLTPGALSTIERHGAYDLVLCPVDSACDAVDGGALDGGAGPAAMIELWMPPDAAPPVRQGWLDFAAALADVAADFHARDELRRLRGASALRSQAVDLLRRVAAPRSFQAAAFELANEGRRLLGCDRLSVLAERRGRWRLVATSGVDAVTRHTDFTRRGERLAREAARWGEPIEIVGGASQTCDAELPPALALAVEEHIDHSHARALACVPIKYAAAASPSDAGLDLVLMAERFEGGGPLRQPLTELGELCAPALARASELECFPVRTALRWSERLAALRRPEPRRRWLVATTAAAALLGALMFVPCDFDIEAPAHLAAAVERDVFASADGAVAEVRVRHGDTVAEGDVLVVLNDPHLALKMQEVQGEIDVARRRLDALAVSRTDRALRPDEDERLPPAAEQRELQERLASLKRQRMLLDESRHALTLRSPIAGQVLTRDVQSMLSSRPVERGQALLTIADASTGWELRAQTPQRDIGHVLAAQAKSNRPLSASYRLAGDITERYRGHVTAVSAAAPLDAEGLRDEAPSVEVRIAVDGAPPAAARPGMGATVRVHCGQKPLGYVWLHGVAATLYRWATF